MYTKKEVAKICNVPLWVVNKRISIFKIKPDAFKNKYHLYNEKSLILIKKCEEQKDLHRKDKYSNKKIRIIEFWLIHRNKTKNQISKHLSYSTRMIHDTIVEYLENGTITVASKL